jgi:NADH-quinone oxidoreductase subunit N
VAAELLGISAFWLAYVSHSPNRRTRADRPDVDWNQFFLPNVLASAALLYGFSVLYGLAGTTNLDDIGSVFRANYAPPPPSVPMGSMSRLGTVAMLLIVAGFGFRMAIVPFHFSNANVVDEVAPPAVPLLAVLPTAAGFVALARLLPETLTGSDATQQLLLIVLALTTMTVGNCMAFAETRIVRKVAHLAATQTGYLLIGLAAGSSALSEHAGGAAAHDGGLPGAIPASYLFLIAYALAVTGVGAVLVYLSRIGRPVKYVSELSGLVRSEPAAAVCAAICLLTLAGLPPTLGFWGRLFLMFAALGVQVESTAGDVLLPHGGFVALALAAAINGLLTAVVCLRLIIVLHFEPQIARPQPRDRSTALVVALIAAALIIGLSVLPGPIIRVVCHLHVGGQ